MVATKEKLYKCIECKTLFKKSKSTQKACSFSCAIAIAKKQTKKEQKVKDKKLKESITDYKKKLQSKIQEIARLIDYGQVCLARQNTPKQAHGGHLFHRSGNENFAMNLHNIFLQSAQSNHFGNDDGIMRDGVVREFGEPYLEFIRGLKSTPTVKRSNEEHKEIYEVACSISNRLKKNPIVLSPNDRIVQRNLINTELGIYEQKYCEFKID